MRRILTFALLAASAPIALAVTGTASAQPFVMSDTQADRVTAGAVKSVQDLAAVRPNNIAVNGNGIHFQAAGAPTAHPEAIRRQRAGRQSRRRWQLGPRRLRHPPLVSQPSPINPTREAHPCAAS